METLRSICQVPIYTRVRSWSSFGNACDLASVVRPQTIGEAIAILGYLDRERIPYTVLGNCTNVLFAGDFYRELCVDLRGLKEMTIDADRLYAEAGVKLIRAIDAARRAGLSGMEELCGIPGTIGAAVAGNAGAYGKEMGAITEYADVWYEGALRRMTREELGFVYRGSRFADGRGTIIGVRLKLMRADPDQIANRIAFFTQKRRNAQPRERSLGSVFRRTPQDVSAAYYVDRAGLKGASVGGAEVSRKHAGFIVNPDGQASGEDFVRLAEAVRQQVDKLYGIALQYEVKILR